MSVIRVGSTSKYADNWTAIFGGKKAAKKAKKAKAKAAKKPAKKKSKKKRK